MTTAPAGYAPKRRLVVARRADMAEETLMHPPGSGPLSRSDNGHESDQTTSWANRITSGTSVANGEASAG
jgi:hypothetical protein